MQNVPLDMDLVARRALGVRSWRLEYQVDGAPFVWTGEASNESAADSLARYQLALPSNATLVACVEA